MSVVHMMNTAGMALQKQIPYLTFNHFKKSLGAGEQSYNQLFSLAGNNFVRGLVICHTPSTKLLADVAGSSVVVPPKAKWEDIQAPFSTGQMNYAQFVDVDRFYC